MPIQGKIKKKKIAKYKMIHKVYEKEYRNNPLTDEQKKKTPKNQKHEQE